MLTNIMLISNQILDNMLSILRKKCDFVKLFGMRNNDERSSGQMISQLLVAIPLRASLASKHKQMKRNTFSLSAILSENHCMSKGEGKNERHGKRSSTLGDV